MKVERKLNVEQSVNDTVLIGMAAQLREALVQAGADPTNPPSDSRPPADRAYREYCARGGDNYDDAESFVTALVEEVVRQSKQD
jgi:hypothetical protein